MERSNNTGKLIGALIVGAAIGGALGILFAPHNGSETRRRILAQGEDLTDGMKEKFNDFSRWVFTASISVALVLARTLLHIR